MMGNVEIGHSEKEKYLGDYIHEKGIVENINATIKARTNGLISKCDEIIKICELMKWRVAERKLNFVNKIMAKENSNITMSEVLLEDMQNVTIKGGGS